jgi:hypothetical protein
VLGCGERGPAPDGGVAATVLPRLLEMPIPVPEYSPGAVASPVVAGPEGGWLYAPGDLRSSALVLVEPGGRVARPLGGFGEGPGEMLASFPLWLDDSVAIGHDLATRRLIVWSRDGEVRREFRPREPVVPIGRGPGTTLLGSRFKDNREVPVLIDLASGAVRDAVAPTDSVLVALFRDDASLSDRVANAPAIGRWRDGVVVANGLRYAMALWDRNGVVRHRIERDLPPAYRSDDAIERELRALRRSPLARRPEQLAELRQRMEATPVARFSHFGAPRSDRLGRLWVVAEEGDSVSADVFTAERFLGRLPLDCPGFGGRWDLADDWLMLVCAPRDPASDLDAEVRRYRIVEP